jgi:hypothetical protein
MTYLIGNIRRRVRAECAFNVQALNVEYGLTLKTAADVGHKTIDTISNFAKYGMMRED